MRPPGEHEKVVVGFKASALAARDDASEIAFVVPADIYPCRVYGLDFEYQTGGRR